MALEPKDESGRLYHITLGKNDVGRIALLPGDPDRVPLIAKRFIKSRLVSSHREYTTYGGYVGNEYVIAMSTGIGGPAIAIAVEELARLGVKVMVRVGTCGAITGGAKLGSVVIADSAVRMDGASAQYVHPGYPAAASPGVVMALARGAELLRKPHTVGIAASTDSFYVGQGRKSFGGYSPSDKAHLVEDLRKANVLAFEMESATLFTLARIFGIKAGALFAVVANRATNEFKVGAGVDDAIDIAIEGIRHFKEFGV